MHENRYPEFIMRDLRERRGLDPDDTSDDEYINTFSPDEAFNEVLLWNGLIGFDITIRGWIEDIYGVVLSAD